VHGSPTYAAVRTVTIVNPDKAAHGITKDFPTPKLNPRDHYHQWIDACLGNTTTAAGFDYSGPLTETVLLGTVALLCAGEKLSWDAARMKVTNRPEANRHLRRTYREGWEVEGL
jgi:hypothetical protein